MNFRHHRNRGARLKHQARSTEAPSRRIATAARRVVLLRADGSGARPFTLFLSALLPIAALLAVSAAPALAARGHVFKESFGTPCTAEPCAPGTLKEPGALAFDEESNEVYVLDRDSEAGNFRVESFSETGVFQAEITGPSATGNGALTAASVTIESLVTETGLFAVGEEITAPGLEPGTTITAVGGSGSLEISRPATATESAALSAHQSFFFPTSIAIDNACQLHEPALSGLECEAFDPSAGDLYVADRGHAAIDKFAPSGEFIGQLTGTTAETHFEEPSGLSVDPIGQLWVFQGLGFGVQVDTFSNDTENTFASSRTPTVPSGFASGALFAVDGTHHFYAIAEAESKKSIARFDQSGALSNQFVGGESFTEEPGGGLAVDLSDNDLYADQFQSIARFTPEGSLVERFGTGNLTMGFGIAIDSNAGEVFASDAAAGTIVVFDLESAAAPRIDSEAASAVTGDSATLEAELDPRSEPTDQVTTYHFEYGPCISAASCPTSPYGSTLPIPDGQLAPSFDVSAVDVHLESLQSATTYHFRVVAENGHGPTVGEERQFTTQALNAGLLLPDGRQWELVSPPEKHGALLETIGQAHATQAAASGDAISYTAVTPTEAEPRGFSNQLQVFSSRGPSGWSSKDIALANSAAVGLAPGQEYRLFSEDLSRAIVQPLGSFTPQSSLATDQTPYLRQNSLCASEAPSGNCFLPLITAANAPAGFDGPECPPPGTPECGPRFVGATPDLSHVVVESGFPLTSTPLPPESAGLYEWSAAAPSSPLTLVSLLPPNGGGEELPAEGGELFGYRNSVARHAISDDGTRVIWTEKEGGHHLYLRDLVRQETVQLDAVQGGSGEHGAHPAFQFASPDGSRVFFTDDQRLTPDSGGGGDEVDEKENDLYVCEMAVQVGHLSCQLTDITPLQGGEEAHLQNLVLGGSEAACNVGSELACSLYFVANGELTSGEGAVQGNCQGNSSVNGARCNLYIARTVGSGWGIKLVAVLSADDFPDWNGRSGGSHLAELTARTSPDGRYLAFMSQRSLTGYDNRDASTGARDEEVYLYDSRGGDLRCVSCNPSGSRPRGKRYSEMLFGIDGTEVWSNENQMLAASVPAWTSYIQLNGAARYQPRYLSNSGRLFFNSVDSLVAQDVNGTGDVYQYEPEGVGPVATGCTQASSTFVPQAAGCVSLLTSGTASHESAFLDAGESGGDVFFLTTAKLLPQDIDTTYDVYDAHECSSASPCPPSVSSSPPPVCQGDACQQPASPPNDSTPGSLTFQGAGNVLECSKGKKVKGGRCVKKQKAKKKHPKKHKKSHKKQAKKRSASHNRAGQK
jgi:DNA-binding beta-propeller fold protein YncE